MKIRTAVSIASLLTLFVAPAAHALDDSTAEDLLSGSKCLKCHGIGMKKAGPSYKEIAAKYKGKPNAVAKLSKHVTEPNQVEVDGEKEDHGQLKTKDPAVVKALVEWILAR
ncbi:MAG: class I cytochrome c [Rhodocyclales bacterium]|nr:class I cytochrome c [Rhodocyclales bacterium]